MMQEKTGIGIGGWIGLLVLLAYAASIHQGLGTWDRNDLTVWWFGDQPKAFFQTWPIWGNIETALGYEDAEYRDTWFIHAFFLFLPALGLTWWVIAGTRSAIARALALSTDIAILIFVFYGFAADSFWELFQWRAAALFYAIACAIGFALASPWLAASWLRLNWFWRCVLYLPILFLVVALFRHTTGWDPNLMANFSPWPALPVVGLDIGAYTVVGFLLGTALATCGLALRDVGASRNGREPGSGSQLALFGSLATLTGLLAPLGWFWLSMPVPSVGAAIGLIVVQAIILFFARIVRSDDRATALLRRAGNIAVGALLVFLPIFLGRGLMEADYNASRYVIAQEVIESLHSYYVAEGGEYPDQLDILIEKGYIDEIPQPRVGFQLFYDAGWMEAPSFDYRSLGNSYVLEFVSTEWIQCAYNPPYLDEFGNEYVDEEEYEEEYEGEEGGGGDIWTCPSSRPALW